MCEKPRRLKMFAIMVVVVLLVAVTVAIPRIARAEDGVVASDVNIEEDDVEVLDVAAEEDDVIASDSTTEELEPANATDEAALLVADTTNQDVAEPPATESPVATKPVRRSLSSAKVSRMRTYTFTGKEVKPKPRVKVGKTTLVRGRDYIIKYRRNVWPGTAKLYIKGIGDWKGTVKATFKIRAKYVMVGDSYAMSSPHPWPVQIAMRLGLKEAQWKKLVGGEGYGFHGYVPWTHLIRRARRDVHVSHIVIVGSAGNDVPFTDRQIRAGYRRTIKALRRKYPNARIVHAVPNWTIGNSYYIKTVTGRYSLYKKLAKKYGVYYLPSCERIFDGRYDCLNGDRNHPNDRGADIIAKLVIRDMKERGIL